MLSFFKQNELQNRSARAVFYCPVDRLTSRSLISGEATGKSKKENEPKIKIPLQSEAGFFYADNSFAND
jgi:hypothetical protein